MPRFTGVIAAKMFCCRREYPELEDEDIRQALAFAAALVDDKVLPLPQTQ
jgi:predicted metalloprotease